MSALFGYKYYSRKFMDGLKKYKYSSVDTSPLAKYVMRPWWETFLHYFIPIGMSANSMTVLGFFIALTHMAILNFYDPEICACQHECTSYAMRVPAWTWLYGGLAHFLAHTLDGSDGMQARRTGTSSPLGELMDHGLDSISVSVVTLTLVSTFAIQEGVQDVLPMFMPFYVLSLLVFYGTHWEKYLTGVLYLPWTYDPGMLLSQSLFLVVYFTGDGLFRAVEVATGVPVALSLLRFAILGTAGFSIPCILLNVYSASHDKNNAIIKKQLKWGKALQPGFPIIVLTVTFVAWFMYSPHDVAVTHIRAFFYAWSLIFSNITIRLIVCQMCSQRYDAFNWLLALPLVAMVVDFYNLADIGVTMWILCGSLFALHIHYFVCLIRQVASYLDVPCLAMPQKRK